MDNKTSDRSSGNRSQSNSQGHSGGVRDQSNESENVFFRGGPEPEQARTLAQKFLNFFGFGKPAKQTDESQPNRGKKPTRKKPIQKHPVNSERLFIGNLSYSVKESDLKELFKQAGEVVSAEVVTNRQTKRSKGFGFVTMSSVAEAEKAVNELDGKELNGRDISVSGAKSDGKKDGKSASNSQRSERRDSKPRRDDRKPSRGGRNEGRESRDGRGKGGRRNERSRDGRKGGKGSQGPTVVAMKVEEVTSPNLSMTNLSSDFGESELEHLFAGVAKVTKSEITEGKADIEMASVEDAQTAVRLLHGKDFMGKTLSVAGNPG